MQLLCQNWKQKNYFPQTIRKSLLFNNLKDVFFFNLFGMVEKQAEELLMMLHDEAQAM